MFTQQDIIDFCDSQNYDIRINHNGRWIDQKCTPDVIWSIADFILEYVDNVEETFNARALWDSEYARLTIAETYSKPGTDERTAENEYDKVFSQPLCMFCNAGIIEDIMPGKRHLYRIKNRDVLEYIARNDIYSLRFLQIYIEKVLKDCDLFDYVLSYFDNQDITHYNALKQKIIDFYHDYTSIKKEYEPKRIFTKIINPLAYKYGKKGTERGTVSPNIIIKSDLMYNRDNFRDVFTGKPKGVSRSEWLSQHPEIDRRDGYFEQMMSRAKRELRRFNNENRACISELTQFDENHIDDNNATQMHHIFPKNEFPEIMHYLENLIALTPNQHFNFAHPNNNTHIIDVAAQKVLLIAKTYSIRKNLTEETEIIYDFMNLLFVLSVGWDDEEVLEIEDMNFVDVVHSINYHY